MNTSSNMNRRKFLQNAAVSTAAIGLSSPAMSMMTGESQKKPVNKVGLYSITFEGVWYKGDALTLDNMMVKAKDFGFDGIEIDGKRPHGNPLDMPTSRCKEVRSKANDMGLDIYAVSGNNDFSSPVPEHRECQIVYLRELMRMTADLGVTPLRVFLGWPGVTQHPDGGRYDIARESWQHLHYQFEPEQIWDWCRDGLIESARYAEDYGVTLALQNHQPVIRDWRDMIRMIKEVNSPALKACLDAPILEDKSAENIREAAASVQGIQMLSHFGGEFDRDGNGNIMDSQDHSDHGDKADEQKAERYLPEFVKNMKEIGYDGYFSYELCHPLPVVNGEKVGIDFVEKNARLACEMMKGLVQA